jgi:hypothetical protein
VSSRSCMSVARYLAEVLTDSEADDDLRLILELDLLRARHG